MPVNLATLRSNAEAALASRGVSAPFTYRDRQVIETVSVGIPEVDTLTGGLPRGSLTEICGPSCSGRTSLLFSALASRTSQAEVCALIDGRDSFDPHSAAAAGVELKRLLWVRCKDINQALRATDLLLQGGGFGLIVLDLGDIAPKTVRYVPLNTWFRFRRAVEDTRTILVLLGQESNAKTCASLVLQLEVLKLGILPQGAEPARWATTGFLLQPVNPNIHPSACLLDGYEIHAEVLRSRMQTTSVTSFPHGFISVDKTLGSSGNTNTGTFGTKTIWCYLEDSMAERKSKKSK